LPLYFDLHGRGDVYPAAVVLRRRTAVRAGLKRRSSPNLLHTSMHSRAVSTSVCEALTYNDDTSVAWRTTDAGTEMR